MLQGYKVFYRKLYENGNYAMITVDSLTLQAIISENLIYTDIYEVRVAGFTNAGIGVMSESVAVQPGKAFILMLQFSSWNKKLC